MVVMQVRIVFKPVADNNLNHPCLFYGEYFQYSHRHIETGPDGEDIYVPEPGIDMFVVHRHMRSNGIRMGDVLPIQHLQQMVQLVPKFGAIADAAFTKDNSMDIGGDYYVNNFDDRETYHAILSYQ
jgi:hypothetical protein